ncbi:S1/P1 nuclease [Croceicoccus hydrothermalis]|uniref:S1/P1 nuclease n=1 Tax=Croceicoccus hydrothermalis TaxID=2867964 RepID=UPI001EFB984A|nr:S1/P1 nuclease [Croceicoccus hydrothermalis]
MVTIRRARHGNGEDRGGNDVKVRWFGDETNLPSVWDSRLIDSRNRSYSEYARWLGREIQPSDAIAWWTADPQVWIAEGTQIRDTIYPATGVASPNLSYAYQYEHLDTAEMQLKQSGVRLAAYLDNVFADRP